MFLCSTFDSNYGGEGATIDLGFHNGRFENILFNNNRGAVIRVSITIVANCINSLSVYVAGSVNYVAVYKLGSAKYFHSYPFL